MSSYKKVKQSSIYTIIGKIIEQLAVVVIAWLLIRKLELKEYGIYSLLLGMTSYLNTLTSCGLVPTFRRFLPEFIQKKQIPQFLWTVKFVQLLRAVSAAVVISIIILFFNSFSAIFQISGYLDYFVLFSIGIFFFFQAELLHAILESMFLHKYIAYSNIVYAIVKLAILIFIFYLNYGLLHVLITDLIAYLVLYINFLCFYKINEQKSNYTKEVFVPFSKTGLIKRLFRYSGFSLLNQIGKNFIDISTDLLVISHFLGPSQLGYYAFSARVGRMIISLLPSRMMRSVVSPTFFAHYSGTGSKSELNRMFKILTKINAFICFPIFSIVAILGGEVIKHIFDPKYMIAFPVMLILFVHFCAFIFPVGMPLQAIEKPEIMLIAKLSSIYNLVMDIILIQLWGIIGVAIATSSSIILKKIFEYNMAKKHAKIQMPWKGLIKIFINCSFIIWIGFWSKQFVHDLQSLIIIGLFLMMSYLLFSYVNKPFQLDERNTINKIIGKNYFVF